MTVAPQSPQFKQHPVALGGFSLLNADVTLVKAAAPGVDTLLIGPPSAYVDGNGGEIVRLISCLNIFVGRLTAAAMLINDAISLVYKAEGGREIFLAAQINAQPQGEKFTLQPLVSFAMSPNDQGLFLRITQAIGTTLRVDGYMPSYDVRGPVITTTDVTAVDAAPAPGGTGNPANAQVIYENNTDAVAFFGPTPALSHTILDGAFDFSAAILNYDSVGHFYQLFLTDGTTTIEITDTGTLPSVGPKNTTILDQITAVPPGWSLKMSITTPVATRAPRVVLSPVMTNLDVARNDQGGAY